MFETNVDRRSFLRGSALFATAIGLTVVAPAMAQQQDQELDDQQKKQDKDKKDPFNDGKKDSEKKLFDADGREYRICPQCAYNMYKQGRMWVCENCGYSYVE